MKKVKLKEICEVDWGNTNLTKQAYVENGEFLGVSAGGCDGRMDYYDFEAYTPVISAIGANCGKMFLPSEPFVAIKNTITLKPRKEALGTYIYYALLDNHIPCRGGGQPFICKTDTEEYIIPCPSITEQIKIVDRLDKVSSLIEKRKEQLSKLDQLIKSRFIELFGDIHAPSKWEKKPWSELVIIQNGRDYKNIIAESGGYPVYGTGGEMARVSDYLCPENTIIVGRKGTINNPLLVKEKFWNVDTAFGVVVGNQLHYQYFYNFCRMFDFSTLNKQAVLPSTTKADLLKIEIAVPPMELQNRFATFVEQTDRAKLAIQKSIDKLETLKKSLMQQYFG